MAYTELTCDDEGLSLETLYRMSMIDLGDGTYAQRVIDGTALLALLCEGNGYGSFAVGSSGTVVSTTSTNGFITSMDSVTETIDTQPDTIFSTVGSYCLWASNGSGVLNGDLTTLVFADLGDPITQLDTSGYGALTELEVTNGAFGTAIVSSNLLLESIVMDYDATTQDLSVNVAIRIIDLESPVLASVPLPPANAIEHIVINGNLPDTEVNAILANAVTNGMAGGTIFLQYAGNAAPTGQGLLDKAALLLAGNAVTTN